MEKMSEKVKRISIVSSDGVIENDKHSCDTVNDNRLVVIISFFMKLFNTNIMDTVKFCQDQFGLSYPVS